MQNFPCPLVALFTMSLAAACAPDPGCGPDALCVGEGEGEGEGEVAGLELLQSLGGLWEGPATQTVLGDFPTMSMDFRPVGGTLFGRVDLDSENNLRFAFAVEDHGDGPVLVYRNGGYFQGLLRDSRTVLTNSDPAAGTYRFCSLPRGCEYIDAMFELDGDSLLFDATVNGSTHVVWSATQRNQVDVAPGFPGDVIGGPDSDFPEMGAAELSVSWTGAAGADAQLLITLSTSPCGTNPQSCDWSRAYLATPGATATSATVRIDQLHAGGYRVNALLDRDGNNLPNAGDHVALPDQALTVPATGTVNATVNLAVGL